MKILVTVLGFGRSGGFRVLSKLADELISLNNIVYFLCPDVSEDPYFPTKATILWVNNKGHLVEKNISNKKPSFFSSQKHLTLGLRNLDTNFFDIIIANHSLTTIPVKLAGLSSKCLYYVQAYEPDYYAELPGIKNKIFGALSKWSYRMNLFTVVNAELYLNYKILKATRYLYPGVDFRYFYPLKGLGNKKEIITIGTIGRNEKFKGTSEVYNAFIQLRKKYRNIRLQIAFGNPDDFFQKDDVSFVYPHGDEALGNFYRSLDYYICAGTSQLGAFHYPVAEAMSCGIPLITTSYYPANEKNAWLVRPNSSQDIVDKFEMANNENILKMEKVNHALEDAQQFDWKKVGQTFFKYIREQFEKAGE